MTCMFLTQVGKHIYVPIKAWNNRYTYKRECAECGHKEGQ